MLRGDYKQSEFDIPFNRHFYVFKAPRSLEEIDAELKGVTAKIMTMLKGLSGSYPNGSSGRLQISRDSPPPTSGE